MRASEKLKRLKRSLEIDLFKEGQLDFLLTEIPKLVTRRTRLGKGVTDSGDLEKLKPLSESYVLARKGAKSGEARFKAQVGKKIKTVSFKAKTVEPLSSLTTPAKSNLTRTGEMLDSIVGKKSGIFSVIFKSTYQFYFRFKDSRNNDVAKYARLGGRPFFELSKTERAGFARKIGRAIKARIKGIFNS